MRTRFAPSPTGFLHVGGLRTALYSYLMAKQSKGKFIVRIEDTDQDRSVPGAIEDILKTLHWAGINPDEGVMMEKGVVVQKGDRGPYIQSERLEIYKKYAEELLKKGSAYPCFCSSERLEQMRLDQQTHKQAPMYDRMCLSLSAEEALKKLKAEEPHVLRLKIPQSGTITFTDDIRGSLTFQGHTVDDQVILKSDGFPTYHLAHVVDDHLMDIELVIRGEEWLSSLPKHLLLFQELGWKAPRYAHVPLLLNKDKSKLSKRQNDVATEEYVQKGYLPEALINFLSLLGWNPGTEQEMFSMKELIDAFSIERIQKSGAIFDIEKLNWLQGQWIRKIPLKEFGQRIRPLVEDKFSAAKNDQEFFQKVQLIQDRMTFFPEAPEMLSFFYEEPKLTKELLVNDKQKVTQEILPEVIKVLTEVLEGVPENNWTEETLKEILFQTAEEKGFKRGQILWPLRAALTGLPYSPGAFEVAGALGKEKTMERLAVALKAV
ncbi:glutamate--tRNA ligase [Patescibacteria group bacterium]|nr:glutamate--tRNA ligase [Patescibacteria group bacterium]MBU2259619.1 glutamate--tRNA ligase [Patescibacteria group bacterium]